MTERLHALPVRPAGTLAQQILTLAITQCGVVMGYLFVTSLHPERSLLSGVLLFGLDAFVMVLFAPALLGELRAGRILGVEMIAERSPLSADAWVLVARGIPEGGRVLGVFRVERSVVETVRKGRLHEIQRRSVEWEDVQELDFVEAPGGEYRSRFVMAAEPGEDPWHVELLVWSGRWSLRGQRLYRLEVSAPT